MTFLAASRSSILGSFGHVFRAKMHIRGNKWVIFTQFVSRFLANFAYKGKMWGHLHFLGHDSFSRREQLAATDIPPTFWIFLMTLCFWIFLMTL